VRRCGRGDILVFVIGYIGDFIIVVVGGWQVRIVCSGISVNNGRLDNASLGKHCRGIARYCEHFLPDTTEKP
jgi:hypothetical protein